MFFCFVKVSFFIFIKVGHEFFSSYIYHKPYIIAKICFSKSILSLKIYSYEIVI